MSLIPDELKYTESHEWLRIEDDGLVTIGITDNAQEELSEIVFVELPEPENYIEKGNTIAVIESVKAASDIYSPVTGEIEEINDELIENPALINSSPYQDGWLFKLKMNDPEEIKTLLDADDYKKQVD